ncbi:MAG TPA: tetratricopeptide repeat protein [Bacteroidales bacterium]|nr:tetratricopeptide repeat protein [Bacteroidales bacterium]
MIQHRKSYKNLLLATIIIILAGCSVEKNTRTSRFFQGLTSRYNIYFNGLESFKAGVDKIDKNYIDDFSGVLKVFEYSDPATQSICASDMERAIQKASKVISLKSITVKPEQKGNAMPTPQEEEFMNRKEYNEWVDDSYLLMGKARLFKRDFELSKSTLSFTLGLSVDDKLKTETTIWLARVYNETGNYNESARILKELDSASRSFDRELRKDFYLTIADRLIKQKKYSDAIDPLSKALTYIRKKRENYRMTYILAQLCEKSGDAGRATELYSKVAKMNPPYEYEFNARINLAGVFDVNSGNPNTIRKELEKMLGNSKNKDFRDQIYFALGNLNMKEGNINEAIEYYKRSANSSNLNRNQKAKAYLALADFYYNKPAYVNSGLYYDSALIFIDSKYTDYAQIKGKSQNLNSLVSQLNIIEREDSLQKIARMSEQERTALVNKIIDKLKEDEKNRKPGEAAGDRYNLGQYYENERRNQNNIDAEGKWYFYNQTALTFGRTEFRRRWGDRRLEDNWRRLNKSRIASIQQGGGQDENGQVKVDSAKTIMDNKKPEFYLKNLPLTDSLLGVSNDRIASAYLESGKVYSEKFNDNFKAVESFEKLIKRFPGGIYEPEALYSIYKIYSDEKRAESEIYRQKLVEKYPDNEFTKIITDPSYFTKVLELRHESGRLYQSAYELYRKEDFKGTIALCEQALSRYPKDELVPKFMLLQSYCTAKIADERAFKESLNKLIKAYPSSQEATRAKDIVAFINNKVPELKVEEDKQVASEIYIQEPAAVHTFVVIIENPAFNINQATFDVISYNIDNYTNKNLRTSGSLVDDKFIIIAVSGFQKPEDAMDYYKTFKPEIIRNPSDSRILDFIIGKTNMDAFMKDKKPERYLLFFKEKYLKEEGNK